MKPKPASRLLIATAAALAVFSTHSLTADDAGVEPRRVPRLQGGFGTAESSTIAPPAAYVVPAPAPVPAPVAVVAMASASTPVSAASSTASSASATVTASSNAAAACPVRDPDDGACYPNADAADQAWLAKGPVAPGSSVSSEIIDDDPDADDEDADDSEDGGTLAPVDAPRIETAGAAPQEKKSFWRDLGRRVTRLVVRKADSRPASIPEEELELLFNASFPLPIRDFPEEKLRDSFDAPRGAHRRHHAIDLPAPHGTPVVAVVDGVIERIGRDRRGGKVCYLRDVSGRFTFYYAHLSQHQKGLRAGDHVKKGDRLGLVGATGHASGPHLHFAIFRQDDKPRELVLNPYLVFTALVGR